MSRLLILLTCLCAACANDLPINAPFAPRLVVYGVLDPNADYQYVRLTRMFQTEEDALQYAASEDLNLKRAVVTLGYLDIDGVRREKRLTPHDTLREPGTFNRPLTVFRTDLRIRPGVTYYLRVEVSDDTVKTIATAHTTPPRNLYVESPRDNDQCACDDENFAVSFRVLSGVGPAPSGYLDRLYLRYGAAGEPNNKRLLQYGPRGLLWASDVTSCGPGDSYCMNIGRDFRGALAFKLGGGDTTFYYDAAKGSTAVWVEVAGLDSALALYSYVNNVWYEDFATVRPEYTNVQGGLGVFGSVNLARGYFRLTPCTRFRARLNDESNPGDCD